jgi:hypothetical protein
MHPPPSEPPSGSRRGLVFGLLFLLGLAVGFGASQLFGAGADERLPPSDLVLYESASVSFPIEGAAFTASTFDQQTGECDPQLLKQFLRADERRFEAWLDVRELTEAEFDGYVDRLQTRILDEPTPFTNHGCFADGEGPCPFDIQTVLGIGTAVWYDPVTDEIVAKSGPLGGEYEGLVSDMGLFYVRLETRTGPVALPNAGVLASAVGSGVRAAEHEDRVGEQQKNEGNGLKPEIHQYLKRPAVRPG